MTVVQEIIEYIPGHPRIFKDSREAVDYFMMCASENGCRWKEFPKDNTSFADFNGYQIYIWFNVNFAEEV